MKTDLVVGTFIFNKNKVLLIHHKKLDLWLPVGGHIDPNETPDQAVKREVSEEVGLDVDFIHFSGGPLLGNVKQNLAIPFHVNLHTVGDHDHCGFFYITQTKNPEQLQINNEVNAFDWFTKEELNQERVSDEVRHIALRAFDLMQNGG